MHQQNARVKAPFPRLTYYCNHLKITLERRMVKAKLTCRATRQGLVGSTFMSSGTGTGMDNSIAKNQEQEGNKNISKIREHTNSFPNFRNGKDWKKLISSVWVFSPWYVRIHAFLKILWWPNFEILVILEIYPAKTNLPNRTTKKNILTQIFPTKYIQPNLHSQT